jgi:hypothetical protein
MPPSPPPPPPPPSPLPPLSPARRWIAEASFLKSRIVRACAVPDRGSSTLETIVIAALIFAAALGAVGAIIAVIGEFQDKLG